MSNATRTRRCSQVSAAGHSHRGELFATVRLKAFGESSCHTELPADPPSRRLPSCSLHAHPRPHPTRRAPRRPRRPSPFSTKSSAIHDRRRGIRAHQLGQRDVHQLRHGLARREHRRTRHGARRQIRERSGATFDGVDVPPTRGASSSCLKLDLTLPAPGQTRRRARARRHHDAPARARMASARSSSKAARCRNPKPKC